MTARAGHVRPEQRTTVGIVADAAGSLLPLFVVIWLIFIVWRLIRVNS